MLTLFFSQVLLGAPRRSAAVPNAAGTLALYTVSTYSFESHSKTSEIRVLDLKTGQAEVLTNDLKASNPTWLGKDNLLLWLQGGEKGTTTLVVADVDNLVSTYVGQPALSMSCTDCYPDLKSSLHSMAQSRIRKSYPSIRIRLHLRSLAWLHPMEIYTTQRLPRSLNPLAESTPASL